MVPKGPSVKGVVPREVLLGSGRTFKDVESSKRSLDHWESAAGGDYRTLAPFPLSCSLAMR